MQWNVCTMATVLSAYSRIRQWSASTVHGRSHKHSAVGRNISPAPVCSPFGRSNPQRTKRPSGPSGAPRDSGRVTALAKVRSSLNRLPLGLLLAILQASGASECTREDDQASIAGNSDLEGYTTTRQDFAPLPGGRTPFLRSPLRLQAVT